MRPLALALALGLAGCAPQARETVAAKDYSAFYLWAGVPSRPELAKAKTLYLLAGEVRRDGGYLALRATPRVTHGEVWLVVRSQSLAWSAAVRRRIFVELARWAASNRLAGLQVDFDASTRHLDTYAAFLRGLRAELPSGYRLSVTGLMDWSAHGDPAEVAGLRGVIDEVVIQTYQARRTIPGYETYLKALPRMPLPYRLALVEGGRWRAPAGLGTDPHFHGYVVFLLPPISRGQ